MEEQVMKHKGVYLFRSYLTHYFALILTGFSLTSTTTVLAEESSFEYLPLSLSASFKDTIDNQLQSSIYCESATAETQAKIKQNCLNQSTLSFAKKEIKFENLFLLSKYSLFAKNIKPETSFISLVNEDIKLESKFLLDDRNQKQNTLQQNQHNYEEDNIFFQNLNVNNYYLEQTTNDKYIFARSINQDNYLISEANTDSQNENSPASESKENNERNNEYLSYPATVLGNPPQGPFRSLTDNIFPTTQPHLGDDLSLTDYYQWKRKISAENGFDFVIATAPIFQVGSNNTQVYFDNELDILAQWRLFENEQTEGKFFSWIQYVQTFSNPTGEFAASQNLITLPNGGATDPKQYVIAVSALWWEQSLLNGHLSYRIGQLYAPALWGTNKYLGDDRITFMNSVLANPQGVNWPSRGIGANVTLGNDSVYTAVGFQDATANQNGLDFTSFGDGRFFYLGEVGYTPKINDKYEGAYRATVSYIDRTSNKSGEENRPGWSMILSAQQDFSDHFGVFAIYRQSWERFTNGVFSTAGAGVVFNQPFDWDDDQVGIGYFYANPTNPDFRDEHGLEMYYKLQLTHRLEFTPDMQIIFTPARNDGMVVIPGLRLRYVL